VAKAGGSVEGAISELSLKDKTGAEIEKRLPGGKVKKKAKAEVVLETSTRSKKKCVTTIQGTAPLLAGYSLKPGDGTSYLPTLRQSQASPGDFFPQIKGFSHAYFLMHLLPGTLNPIPLLR
jgi:hypothetical protein